MAKPVIIVRDIGKLYTIGGPQVRYKTLRESLSHLVGAPFHRFRNFRSTKNGGQNGGNDKTVEGRGLWALKEISFDVNEGDVVGVIGPNGAGKSTLLKILSRITEPTTGEVKLSGRVGSLLEVGTGFHPELTGRENIYLNGAILGMGKAEIGRKFDEIVSFAEVERFLDTPV